MLKVQQIAEWGEQEVNNELERMSSFFDRRADSYETHMKNNVEDSEKFYIELSNLVPETTGVRILDLGCGTGLELDQIFSRNPTARVTGIDLSDKMLEILRSKHHFRNDQLTLIAGSYFEVEFPSQRFDLAISVQSMHHFGYGQKLSLYKKILRSLVGKGKYIEADYVVSTEIEEKEIRNRYETLKGERKVPDGFYHIDLPFSIDNQKGVLEEAGFWPVRHHARYGNASIFVSRKPKSR